MNQTTTEPKKKILIATNVLTAVDSTIYGDHINLLYKVAKGNRFEIFHYAPRRQSIDRMRNLAADYALQSGCDYLLFIDDDMLLTDGTIESLVDANLDIVMADTVIRGYPFHSMSFKLRGVSENNDFDLEHFDDILDHVDENGIAKCVAVGFACCLIRVDLLKKLNKPYFVTSPFTTEDVYFCIRCQQEIPEGVQVGVDTKVPTYHQLDPMYITRKNIPVMKKIIAELQGIGEKSKEDEYRADNYHEKMKEVPECQSR